VTNSSLRYALNAAFAVALSAFAGCEKPDGLAELASARAAYEVRDLKKAEKLLEKSLSVNATNADALVAYAMVKVDLGEIHLAQAAIEKAVAVAGGDVDVRLLSAQIAYHLNDYARAHREFCAVAADESLSASLRSQGFAGAGVVELAGNENDLARISLLKAIRLDRKNAAAWYHLGLIYQGLGYYEAALEQFNIFVRLEEVADRRVQNVQRSVIPGITESINRQASERPGASKRDSAAAAKALSAAETAWGKGQYKTAKLRYQEALDADPLSYPAALGLAKTWEKTDATAAGQKKVFEYYKTACALSPSSVKTFLVTGELATKLGHHATAVEVYSRAMAADPSNITAIDGLIRSLRKVGGKNDVAAAYQGYRDLIAKRR
jgi:tetratricopeptide (TPR) repeat protein